MIKTNDRKYLKNLVGSIVWNEPKEYTVVKISLLPRLYAVIKTGPEMKKAASAETPAA